MCGAIAHSWRSGVSLLSLCFHEVYLQRVEEDCPEGDLDERSKVNHPEPYLVDLSDLREATTAAQ